LPYSQTESNAGWPIEKLQRSTAVWSKSYDWLQWHFPDEEAHEYAEEMTQVAEGRKRETERSAHEIRREMKLLANTEALINTIRVLAAIAALACPFYFLLNLKAGVLPNYGFTQALGTSLLKSRRIQPPPFLEQRYRRGGSLCFHRTGGPIQRFFRVSVDGERR
jgi:hypothetical protein